MTQHEQISRKAAPEDAQRTARGRRGAETVRGGYA